MVGFPKAANPSNPFDRLQNIVETMDIPPDRSSDIKWLSRNIQVRNANHPQFKEACDLIRKLLFSKEK